MISGEIGSGKPALEAYTYALHSLGYETDFFFADLGLVVETDGLRYHRTPAQQARAAKRDQTHTAAGYRVLRFTHWQIAHAPNEVTDVLRRIAALR